PRRSYRGGVHLHNAADSRTVGKHVIVVIVPLAGWAACLGRLEDQRGHGAALNRLALTARMDPAENSLRGYFRTDRYKWAGAGAAGARSRSLVDECDGTSARAAVCGDEHFILVTCRCTCTRAAIDTDNAKRICSGRTCWSRRTGLAFFASRTSWPRRSWFSFEGPRELLGEVRGHGQNVNVPEGECESAACPTAGVGGASLPLRLSNSAPCVVELVSSCLGTALLDSFSSGLSLSLCVIGGHRT